MKTNQYNEPDMIFLQLHDPDDEGKTELADPEAEGVTWCWEPIHHNDVEYIRKDLYDDLKNQVTAYQLTIANMEAERKQEPTRWLNPSTNHTISNSTKFTSGGEALFSGYCIKLFGSPYAEDNDTNSEISKKPWRINIDAAGDYFISADDNEHVADVNSEYDAKLIVNAVNNFYPASQLPADTSKG